MDFLKQAQLEAQKWIGVRRELHRRPELGRQEHRTQALVEKALLEMGIETRRTADTGIIGCLNGSLPGKTIALRADMDALPIREATALPFASETSGVMHACGHDIHTASLLGAASLLASRRTELHGSVRFFFQPDEEGDGGAQRMIDEGCMEGVDAVFGAHVAPEYPCGTAAVRYGSAYAASNPFDITITGRSSHGAEPQLGADAIAAASQLVCALQTIVSRGVNPLDSAVITVGSFHGGTARNIIADSVHLSGIIRSFGSEQRAKCVDQLTRIAHHTTQLYGCTAKVDVVWGYEGIINDRSMTACAERSLRNLLGSEQVIVEPVPTLTTEDFGAFLHHAPGSFWHIGVGRADHENAPLHNPLFDPDERAIAIASAAHAQIVWDQLINVQP